MAANKVKWQRWRLSRLEAEPAATEKDIVRIALKLPGADRITRRFRAQDPIEELYAFADTLEVAKEGEVGKAEKPEGYDHKFDFRIVQTLPRSVFAVEEGGTIGERVGRSGNLIVEPILEEEEGDE